MTRFAAGFLDKPSSVRLPSRSVDSRDSADSLQTKLSDIVSSDVTFFSGDDDTPATDCGTNVDESAVGAETLLVAPANRLPGEGGSAIPCGFVFPAASAKTAAADWLPLVRIAESLYRYTRSVPLSTIQICRTSVGSIVMPVGADAPDVVIIQLPRSLLSLILYLKTLSAVLSFTTQIEVPSVTRSLESLLALFKAKLLVGF